MGEGQNDTSTAGLKDHPCVQNKTESFTEGWEWSAWVVMKSVLQWAWCTCTKGVGGLLLKLEEHSTNSWRNQLLLWACTKLSGYPVRYG